MKPLFVLLAAFATGLLLIWIFGHLLNFPLAGCIAMAIMLLFTGIAHFKYTKGMALMMPDFMPVKTALVYFTGVVEIAGAAGLLIPSLKITAAWLLILFFVLILPANIYATTKHVNYEKGNFQGKGTQYLWFRIPLQLFFIGWIYFFVIKYSL